MAKSPLEEWIYYLNTGEIPDGATAPGLDGVREHLKLGSMSKEELRAYYRHLDNLVILHDCIFSSQEKARFEGMAKGLAEGRAEGRAEGIAEGRAAGIVEGRAEGIAFLIRGYNSSNRNYCRRIVLGTVPQRFSAIKARMSRLAAFQRGMSILGPMTSTTLPAVMEPTLPHTSSGIPSA